MRQNNNRAVISGVILSAVIGTQSAQAQQDSPDRNEKIKITGSRIKRTDVEGANAVQVIDREKIESSGFTSVGDVLRETSVSTHGAMKEESGRAGAGAAGSNLRGLGEEYTLVLVNGRRLPNDPILGVPDVNLIPLVAIERIEIMKEGASAIYGSDAIGGVINIITKKEIDGTSFLYSQGFTSEKGGEEQRLEATTGSVNKRGYTTFSLSWRNKEVVMAKDRKYSADGWSSTGSPGSYRTIPVKQNAKGEWERDGDSETPEGKWKAAADCSNDSLHRIQDIGGGNTQCQFNYGRTASIVPKIDQLALMLDGEYALTDDIKGFISFRKVRRTTTWNYAPAPDTFYVFDPSIANSMGVESAENQGLEIRYRTVELGTRDTLVETHSDAGTIGLRGELSPSWEWELTASKSRSHAVDRGVKGYWLKSRMGDLVTAGEYNPLDPNRNPANADSARYQTFGVSLGQLDQVDGLVTGELAMLPGGPMGVAIGVSAIEDYFLSSNDTLSVNGEVAGSSGSNGEGRRHIKSAYAELVLPLHRMFEINLATRQDQYSDVGNATSPQVSLKLVPLPSLLFRSTVGRGFRAPSLQALNDEGGYGYPSFIDVPLCEKMKTAGDQAGIENACNQSQYLVNSVKADKLKPEQTSFASLGVVFAPSQTFELAMDYWATSIRDRIAVANGRNLQSLMEAERKGANFGSRGIQIGRDSDGYLDEITLPNTNMSTTSISGLDLDFKVQTRLGDVKPALASTTTYFLAFEESLFSEMGKKETIGSYGRPRWKMSNVYSLGFVPNHSVAITQRITASHNKANEDAGEIPRYTEYDAQYVYQHGFGGAVTLGVTNLTNEKPPEDTTANPTVDVSMYNNLGRNYYLKVTQDL